MRDGDDGAALHEPLQALDHQAFGLGVQRCGWFVENEDGRVANDGAGDADALALAPRERQPALADKGAIAAGHCSDEVMRVGELGGFDDFLFGGSGPPISDVLAYRSPEQHRLLQNETDLSAKRSLAVVPDVDPVDHDAPCVGVIEARDEPHDGGLATAGRADDAYHLAGCDAEVHVAKDEVLRIVAESHVLDGDLASCAA